MNNNVENEIMNDEEVALEMANLGNLKISHYVYIFFFQIFILLRL